MLKPGDMAVPHWYDDNQEQWHNSIRLRIRSHSAGVSSNSSDYVEVKAPLLVITVMYRGDHHGRYHEALCLGMEGGVGWTTVGMLKKYYSLTRAGAAAAG